MNSSSILYALFGRWFVHSSFIVIKDTDDLALKNDKMVVIDPSGNTVRPVEYFSNMGWGDFDDFNWDTREYTHRLKDKEVLAEAWLQKVISEDELGAMRVNHSSAWSPHRLIFEEKDRNKQWHAYQAEREKLITYIDVNKQILETQLGANLGLSVDYEAAFQKKIRRDIKQNIQNSRDSLNEDELNDLIKAKFQEILRSSFEEVFQENYENYLTFLRRRVIFSVYLDEIEGEKSKLKNEAHSFLNKLNRDAFYRYHQVYATYKKNYSMIKRNCNQQACEVMNYNDVAKKTLHLPWSDASDLHAAANKPKIMVFRKGSKEIEYVENFVLDGKNRLVTVANFLLGGMGIKTDVAI